MERFLEAQNPVYSQVCSELRAGQKTSHWMWFIFPQIMGLGHSPMAQKYALASVREATEYLQHPVLGPRLRECTALVNAIEGRSAQQIFGGIDRLKFCSSMTLFAHATTDNSIFEVALQKYFAGTYDPMTMERI